jgi:uncharacterized membrane protein YbhN (UPF0104 family)
VSGATTAARQPPPVWAWVRVLGGICILGLLMWRVGTGPFLDGVRAVDAKALVAASGIGVVTTACCAWRWRLIAGGLGVRLALWRAVAAYYRSQFLNATLPGGVIGDVHRAVRHGLDIGDVGLGVRAVVLDRLAGQAVQVAVAVVVLFALPSPVRRYMPIATIGVVVAGFIVVMAVRALVRGGSTRSARALRSAALDLRDGLVRHRAWVGIALTSCVVVAGHLTTFLIAARAARSTASSVTLVPLVLLALLAMSLPTNVAGWGPREGAAAWAFGAAGLTAAQGVATAVTYGVLVLVATLPGAAVLVARWLGREPAPTRPDESARSPEPVGGRRG